MLADRYGLPVSSASAAARDAYVEGYELAPAATSILPRMGANPRTVDVHSNAPEHVRIGS